MPNDNILHLQLDPECLKLDDPRINRVRAGKMSIEVFTLLIQPNDPFVIINDTIYAMTPQEYYASKSLDSIELTVEATFNHINELADISFMTAADRTYIERMRKDLPTCPSCRYKRYKDEVYKIAKKYNIVVTTGTYNDNIPPYPALAVRANGKVSDPVLPKVSDLLSHLYSLNKAERKACIDCVRKHVSSAFVLAGESYTGYPEHIAIINAHYGEAIEEMPKAAMALRRTLEFCMAKTAYMKQAFVPIGAIMALLRMTMLDMTEQADDTRTEAATTLELDVTEEMCELFKDMPDSLKNNIKNQIQLVDKSILEYKNSKAERALVSWEGAMSVLAERIAQVMPELANVIRNRRLLFRGDPTLMLESGYSMQDILQYM